MCISVCPELVLILIFNSIIIGLPSIVAIPSPFVMIHCTFVADHDHSVKTLVSLSGCGSFEGTFIMEKVS